MSKTNYGREGGKMTLKECLIQYCDVKTEVGNLEKRISDLEKENSKYSIVQASSLEPPYCLQEIKINHTNFKKAKELEKQKCILDQRYIKLLELQTKVEEEISKLPTSRLRMIFEFKYIDNLSWQQVAWRIGNKATEDSVKKEYYRYLEKI